MRRHSSTLTTTTIFLAHLLSASSPTSALDRAAVEEASKVDVQWHVKIPLRDGIRLNATVYRPAALKSPRPCLFTLTPYVGQTYHERGVYFAAHDFPFLTVDVRGRGDSEGTFKPNIQEATDGYDVVEWLARQPYCNGKVGMWGGSYAGYDQWATAKALPPHLATIVPVAAPVFGVDFPARNNLFAPYDIQWLNFTSGRTSQDRIFGDGALWISMWTRWSEAGTSYRNLDSFVGNPSAVFQEWVQHPSVDAYWDSYNPTSDEYASLSLPILTITGMYDDDQPGALAHYRRYMMVASAASKAKHFLIIGPWDHPGTRTPKRQFLGMNFGAESLLDLPQLHLDWYRFTMAEGEKPAFLRQAVAYYVTGADVWRYADSLEAITARTEAFFLDSAGGSATSSANHGDLRRERAGRGAPDQYRYDPADLSLEKVESVSNLDSLLDQTVFLANKAHVVYVSQALPSDAEISGFFRLKVWISINQPDTDFVVTVSEIDKDGTVTPLSSDVMRARYRVSLREPQLVKANIPLLYDFHRFTFASRLVRAGCHLQVTISANNSLLAQKNHNSGKDVADETQLDSRPVTVSVFHNRSAPSALYVPYATRDISEKQ